MAFEDSYLRKYKYYRTWSGLWGSFYFCVGAGGLFDKAY